MAILKKVFNGLTLRCFGAVFTGLAMVAVITTGLLILTGGSEDMPAARMTSANLRFPEDEQMLKDVSAQILKDAHVAAGTEALQDIEPAAGSRIDRTAGDK